ncbi:MAG TPA: PPOX class F420-dependent oxidoreductase [Acidimicrobiales bacterium]|nr:PPOX class F420-dependent oxidoreductase [Acidimicrobiales bacterium]
MTPQEVEDFLAGARTLQVATINPDGTPHLVAMWYTLSQGKLGFWTYGRSQKVQNLRRDPRISCMVEEGTPGDYGSLRGVSVKGEAVVVEDPEVVLRLGQDIATRYLGGLDDAARAGVAHTSAKRVAVIVTPERVLSWDHRKLSG